MALGTPTHKTALFSVDGNVVETTASFAVAAGELIIVSAAAGNAPGAPATLSISDSDSHSWTEHENLTGAGDFTVRHKVWSTIAASATSITVTVTASAENGMARFSILVVGITGAHATTPVPQSEQNGNTGSATLVVTLASTPANRSAVIAFVACQDGTNVAPGSGFTELHEGATASAPDIRMQSMYDLTGADTTADWSGLPSTFATGIAIEVAEAGGGGPPSAQPIPARNVAVVGGR